VKKGQIKRFLLSFQLKKKKQSQLSRQHCHASLQSEFAF